MRLESVLAVTGGRLLNSPSISGFDTVALSPRKVTRGSLFVAKRREEIVQALQQGAYGIITDLDLVPQDEEVAWIRTDNLAEAMVRLLRLWLVENPRNIRYVPAADLEFVEQIGSQRSLVIIAGSEEQMSETLFLSHAEQILLCGARPFIERIGASVEPIEPAPVACTVTSSKIFETSLVLDGTYHPHLFVIPCMVPHLLHAVGILKTLSLPYFLQHLHHTPSLKPVFVDACGREVAYGSSEHVLVFAENSLLCACKELFENATWIRRRIFFPKQIKFNCDIKMTMYPYESLERLLMTIREEFAKPAYTIITGTKRERVMEHLPQDDAIFSNMNKGLF
ncbi:hypothetical protein [Hydrogenimonas urashimensis]|uniref:hypothetical protein n=1 Tax=Hydrogenimonas urashimensis TaxID=2740515 RepID=UPI00191584F0|nr:hypothetical protein [Hydrogenimonas urashimensis]